MSSRQKQFSGTREVDSAYKFNLQQLQEYMLAHVDGFHGSLTARQFKGGQSNPTYLLESSSGQYVLRRKPPGKLLQSAHAVDREFTVTSALHAAGFPVPRPLILCKETEIIGTMFYIMEFVSGRIFWESTLPESDPDERAAIYSQAIKTLTELHNFDVSQLGLSEFGRSGNYFARQISRWSKQYIASATRRIPSMDKLIAWLPDRTPEDMTSTIVHGDYRLDNMVIHATEPRVLAVLDWELSTIGHPLADFTYHLMNWQMPDIGIGSSGLLGKDIAALGIPSEEQYIATYCERTGVSLDSDSKNFYSAYNFFRIAAILQGVCGRVRDGTAASAHAARAGDAVEPLADIGWRFAQQAGG